MGNLCNLGIQLILSYTCIKCIRAVRNYWTFFMIVSLSIIAFVFLQMALSAKVMLMIVTMKRCPRKEGNRHHQNDLILQRQ